MGISGIPSSYTCTYLCSHCTRGFAAKYLYNDGGVSNRLCGGSSRFFRDNQQKQLFATRSGNESGGKNPSEPNMRHHQIEQGSLPSLMTSSSVISCVRMVSKLVDAASSSGLGSCRAIDGFLGANSDPLT